MTVQYSQLVLTGGPGVFFKLLLKWRGCVFKLIYVDILIFLLLYFSISFVYRFALSEELQRSFERLVQFIYHFQAMIPVAFILGFYVSLIFARFWHQFMVIPWILKMAIGLTAHLPGSDERTRLLRRTCMRYVMGGLILTCTRVNVVAKRRFPNYEAFVTAGIFTEEETKLLDSIDLHFQPFVPIVWATSLITLAEKEKIITNEHALVFLISELNSFRQGLLNVFFMDYVCVPLVYTQVVTLSVYSYLIASLFGRQYIMTSSPLADPTMAHDFYFPFFTILELIIYVGWLKVAETLLNPMGEDDEDIDINEVIDFNWKAAWCIVDGVKPSPPAVVRDAHWNQTVVELPHTEESRQLVSRPCRGSVYDLNLQSSNDFIGSVLSMTGIRPTQESFGTPGAKRSSVLNVLRKPTLLQVREPYLVESPTSDEPDFQVSLTVPVLLSPSRQTAESNEEDRKSSTVLMKPFAETIKEENEEELESYIQADGTSNTVLSQDVPGQDIVTSTSVQPEDDQPKSQ